MPRKCRCLRCTPVELYGASQSYERVLYDEIIPPGRSYGEAPVFYPKRGPRGRRLAHGTTVNKCKPTDRHKQSSFIGPLIVGLVTGRKMGNTSFSNWSLFFVFRLREMLSILTRVDAERRQIDPAHAHVR